MKKRSAVDPTTLTPEEQIARYDEIIAILAEEPADDAGKIGQYVQVAGIVNRPVAAAEEEAPAPAEEEAPAAEVAPEDEDDEEETQPAANPHAAAIAASPEGKANPAGALQAIQAGLTLQQFKAMAPNLGKPGASAFHARMAGAGSAQRLGADAGGKVKDDKVVKLPTAKESFDRRKAELERLRKAGGG